MVFPVTAGLRQRVIFLMPGIDRSSFILTNPAEIGLQVLRSEETSGVRTMSRASLRIPQVISMQPGIMALRLICKVGMLAESNGFV